MEVVFFGAQHEFRPTLHTIRTQIAFFCAHRESVRRSEIADVGQRLANDDFHYNPELVG
jgi:hypothetical protein